MVPFSEPADFIRYLGSKRNLNGSSREEFKNLKELTTTHLRNLRSKLGSARAKNIYLKASTFAKLGYPASFSVGPLSSYRAQDLEIGKFLKENNRLPMSWPGPLLYCPARWGGVGFPRFSDHAQIAKLRILFAGLRGDADTRSATSGLLERIADRETPHTWLISLLSYLQENNCILRRGGVRFADDNPEITMLCPGQFWRFGNNVWQIGGWTETSISGWNWTATHHPRRRGPPISRSTKGALDSVTWESLTGEEALLQVSWKNFSLEIVDSQRSTPGRYTYAPSSVRWPEELLTHAPSRICTDGSWAVTGPFWNPTTRVGAGVALLYPHMQHLPQVLSLDGTYFSSSQRNYTQELVGLLVGAALKRDLGSEASIHTDCQSALKAIAGTRARGLNCSQLLHMIRRITRGQQIHFVRAHTAITVEPSDTDLYGNYLADQAADNSLSHAVRLQPEILLDIADSTDMWYVADEQTLAPATLPAEEGYLSDAVNYFDLRMERHRSSPTMAQVQRVIEAHGKTSEAQRGALLKLILNRFDDDRLLEESKLHLRCPCGEVSHLTAWTSSCSCKEIAKVRTECVKDLKRLLRSRTTVINLVLGKLQGPGGYHIWRGRWSSEDLCELEGHLRLCAPDLMLGDQQRTAGKLLNKIIKTVTTGALNLHTTGRRLRSGQVSPMSQTRRKLRGSEGRQSDAGQRKITQFFHHAQSSSTGRVLRQSSAATAEPPQIGTPHTQEVPRLESRMGLTHLDWQPRSPQDPSEATTESLRFPTSSPSRLDGQEVAPLSPAVILSPAQAAENQIFGDVVYIGRQLISSSLSREATYGI